MGYDMFCAGKHPSVIAARMAFRRTNSPESWEYLQKVERAESAYFRLNISGMRAYRDSMLEAGMLVDAPWPGWDEDGSVTELDTGGLMPIYKFCSNDGWLVSPTEIKTSLKAWDEYTDGGGPLLLAEERGWDRWITFLHHTAEHGGFHVY